jgi:hypothetical protein
MEMKMGNFNCSFEGQTPMDERRRKIIAGFVLNYKKYLKICNIIE